MPDDTENTFASTKYRLDVSNNPNRLVLDDGETWPSNVRDRDAIRIEVTLGYGADYTSLPEDIRNAIRALVMYLYDNRSRGEMKIPDMVKSMLETYVQFYR